ncbi:MAG: putative blue pigment (indigoidine) exporter [Miltoncostaeaceae bacterium]|jgi:drug/metabolite transporter (DMT)-like permease|nr:putative blue pigment (indigoidine) exporter [Miltoncostaeaceae bacterium]
MLGWGAAYVPSAWLVARWPPLLAAGARLTLAGVILLGLVAALGRPLRPGAGPGSVAWLALTQTVLFYGATFWGIAQSGAGLAAVLANTDPLFVAALAALALGERLGRAQWAGLAIGLVGAGVVVWEGPAWPPAVSGSALVMVGGALAWSLGTVVAARGLRGRADPLALAGWQMALGGPVLLGAGALAEGGAAALGGRELALVLGLALVGSAAPAALFYLALVRAPAAEVSAWFFLVPAVGVASAWPLLGEQPGARLWVGLAAVTAGLWLVLRPAARAGGPLVDSAAPVSRDVTDRP